MFWCLVHLDPVQTCTTVTNTNTSCTWSYIVYYVSLYILYIYIYVYIVYIYIYCIYIYIYCIYIYIVYIYIVYIYICILYVHIDTYIVYIYICIYIYMYIYIYLLYTFIYYIYSHRFFTATRPEAVAMAAMHWEPYMTGGFWERVPQDGRLQKSVCFRLSNRGTPW